MNTPALTEMILSAVIMQLPTLVVCLVGGIMTFCRWKQLSRAAIWALLGFGTTFLLTLIIPIVQTNVQAWIVQQQESMDARAIMFSRLTLLWSVLRAASYVPLLVAIFASRPPPLPARQVI